MFKYYTNVTYWKVQLTVGTSLYGKTNYVSNELILKINQIPYNGSCFLNNQTGYALDTYFIVNCSNWIDDDGYIISYEFYGNYFT